MKNTCLKDCCSVGARIRVKIAFCPYLLVPIIAIHGLYFCDAHVGRIFVDAAVIDADFLQAALGAR